MSFVQLSDEESSEERQTTSPMSTGADTSSPGMPGYLEARKKRLQKIYMAVATSVILVITLTIIGVLSGVVSFADNVTRPDVSKYRLPQYMVPTAYRLELQPDLERARVDGTVEIDILLRDGVETDEILLHAAAMNVTSARLRDITIDAMTTPMPTIYRAGVATYNKTRPGDELASNLTMIGGDKQFLLLRFDKLLDWSRAKRTQFTLFLTFEVALGTDMAGFYRSSYTNAQNKTEWVAVTQFEATHARRSFPCFDEPAMKATFEVAMRVDTSKYPTVLSNEEEVPPRVPASRLLPKAAQPPNLQRIRFEKSLTMSPYLLAMFVGRFNYTEAANVCNKKDDEVDNTPPRVRIRVYAPPDVVALNQTVLAARVARCSLEIFEDYFDVAYPLEQLNLIAIPDFQAGAMENWGLITFRMSALLYDSVHSSEVDKERVETVIAHEIAHQWFGNLVTMGWWDELWLNEGFATYMEFFAVNAMKTSQRNAEKQTGWLMWNSFSKVRREALALDSLQSSHPIKQSVSTPDEIDQMFDAISYSKGASIIDMLSRSTIGRDTLNGVIKRYLKANAYSVATSAELWQALAVATNEPQVAKFMETWTLVRGYPVVDIVAAGPGEYVAVQSRYYESPAAVDASDANDTWWLPIAIQNDDAQTQLTLRPGERKTAPFKVSRDYFLANVDRWGFYRVAYAPELMRQITGLLERNGIGISVDNGTLVAEQRKLPPLDFVGMLDDAMAFATSGYANTTAADVFRLAVAVKDTSCFICWSAALDALTQASRLLEAAGSPLATTIMQNITRPLLNSLVRMTLDADLTLLSDHSYQMLMERALPLAIQLGDPAAVDAAEQCWSLVKNNETCGSTKRGVVGAAFQSAVFMHVAVKPMAEFDTLMSLYMQSLFPGEKQRLLNAMTQTNDVAARARLMEWALKGTNGIKIQDRQRVLYGIATKSLAARDAVWNFVLENYATIASGSAAIFGGASNIIASLGKLFATKADLAKFEAFVAANKGLDGFNIKQTVERIKVNINWLARNEAPLADFVSKTVIATPTPTTPRTSLSSSSSSSASTAMSTTTSATTTPPPTPTPTTTATTETETTTTETTTAKAPKTSSM